MSEHNALNPKILIIEDEPDLCEAMVSYLQIDGFFVNGVNDVTSANAWLKVQPVDILILDIGLPDHDGVSWLIENSALREKGLVITTARSTLPDRVRGLAAGADAYLIKPIEFQELSLILKNLATRLEKTQYDPSPRYWKLHPIRWELVLENRAVIKLTRSETAVLTRLAAFPGQPVHRDELIHVLGYTPENYDVRRMEILMRRLRNKVKNETGRHIPIETIHGYGYAFTDEIMLF